MSANDICKLFADGKMAMRLDGPWFPARPERSLQGATPWKPLLRSNQCLAMVTSWEVPTCPRR
ncbi:hypothetical protein LZ30DRAFT_739143 [Colletotrichum cereale]|nr:hypothetical protein LZ30DRAFT_739143 [Colletotrichum cereale]